MRLPADRSLLALSAAAASLACAAPAVGQAEGRDAGPDLFCSEPVVQPLPGVPAPLPEEVCNTAEVIAAQSVPPLPEVTPMPMPMPMPAPPAAYAAPAYPGAPAYGAAYPAAPYPAAMPYGGAYVPAGGAYSGPPFDRDAWLRDCNERLHAIRHHRDQCAADLERYVAGGYTQAQAPGYGYGYNYPAYGYGAYTMVPVVVVVPQQRVVTETITEEVIDERAPARPVTHPRPAPRRGKILKVN